ncbi:MAG: ERCC4-type nuclease [Thermoproteota archaeon]|nr:MAG: ERCC4-type nuclease [Candidatus Korarchaeota archaeon]
MNIKVTVDIRDRHLISLCKKIFKDVEVKQLTIGDLHIYKDEHVILLERKSIRDLFQSIVTNRLWDQLARMLAVEELEGYTVRRRMLLIHGSLKSLVLERAWWGGRDSSTLWAQLMGALQEIVFVYETAVFIAENDDAETQFIRILARREAEGKNDKTPEPRWFRRSKPAIPSKDAKIYLLSSIPQVGDKLARQLLEHFGTIAKIANSRPEELMRVPLVGEKKARVIYEIFH